MKKWILVMAAFLATASVGAEELPDEFLRDYVLGTYHLIGKGVGSEESYYGQAVFEVAGDGMRVTREIGGKSVVGSAAIEKATGDKIKVVRIRFEQEGFRFEETCVIGTDLDNYATLTCHVYPPGTEQLDPGLEAYIAKHKAN